MSKLKKQGEGYLYQSSNGREIPLTEMPYTHLANAIAKMERGGDDPEEIEILKKELATRPAPEEE